MHTLLAFTQTVPAGSTVYSATLRLYLNQSDFNNYKVEAAAITGPWAESSVTWNAAPVSMTLGDAPVPVLATPGWAEWDVTNIVTASINGGLTRTEILLRGADPAQDGTLVFASREDGDGSHAPYLVVWYDPPGTPTPTRTSTSTPTPPPSGTPVTDLGDAPDSINHGMMEMYAYPGVLAYFPTVYDRAGNPRGPKHKNDTVRFYLGAAMSRELEADQPPDEDAATNIITKTNQSDRDFGDDGLVMPLSIQHCGETTMTFRLKKVDPGPADVYVNIWFDSDRNGVWGDTPACGGKGAPEWVLQNYTVTLPAPGMYTFTTPLMGIADPLDRAGTRWLRLTASEQPAQSADGSGPEGGYAYGETEDVRVEMAATPTPTLTSPPAPGVIAGRARSYGDGVFKNARRPTCPSLGGVWVTSTAAPNGHFSLNGLDARLYTVSAGYTAYHLHQPDQRPHGRTTPPTSTSV